MAKIKKDITLGAILNNIHGLGYELKLDNKAMNLVNSIDTGTEQELNDFQSQIETLYHNRKIRLHKSSIVRKNEHDGSVF